MKDNPETLFSMDCEGRPFGYPMSRIPKACIISEYLIGLFCSNCRVQGLSRFLKKCALQIPNSLGDKFSQWDSQN